MLVRRAVLPCHAKKSNNNFVRQFSASAMAASRPPWEESYRLPPTTQPTHYDLYLHPRLEEADFSGRVTIHVDSADAARSHFVAHVAKPLEVTSTRLEREDGEEVKIRDAFEHAPHEFWVVALEAPVPRGRYRLTMDFAGRLDQSILGYYKSVYDDERGRKRAIATSKFQPTYARRCFPCFDEPSFKSTYRSGLKALFLYNDNNTGNVN